MGQVASRLAILMGIAVLLVAACSEGSADEGHRLAAGEACPVTIPPQPGFEPPPPWPSQAPPLYSAVWYGDENLWFLLDPNGERWASDRHGVKLFWFYIIILFFFIKGIQLRLDISDFVRQVTLSNCQIFQINLFFIDKLAGMRIIVVNDSLCIDANILL